MARRSIELYEYCQRPEVQPRAVAERLAFLGRHTQVDVQWTWLIICKLNDIAILHLSIKLCRSMDRSSPFCPFF